ncbi:MAG: hypothetical protein QM477_00480 [Planctomycetota bacterium]
MTFLRRLGLLGLLIWSSCAAPDAEIHLAPFISRHTLPQYQHFESLGGAVRFHREADDSMWAISPVMWRKDYADGEIEASFLGGLGRYEFDPSRPRTYARLFPLWSYRSEVRADGITDTDWSLLFWLIAGGSSSDNLENYFWFFPFFGTGRNFLTFDEFSFFLFPLYLENHKQERHSKHWLWPFFGKVEGSEEGWHVFPFYGTTTVPGRHQSSYIMWPFWTQATTDQQKKHPSKQWMFFPFYGKTTQDDYAATTFLWPFFGWADRPSTDYSSWSFWPFLKFESGGKEADRKIQKVLPFWMHYENAQTEYSAFLWPFFWHTKSHFNKMKSEGYYFVPLFMHSKTLRDDGTEERNLRIWPFMSYEFEARKREVLRVLDLGIPRLLDPEGFYQMFGFLYTLWDNRDQIEADPIVVHEKRAWFNLYHEAEAAGHERWSIPVIGGKWTEPDGTTHSSWLFGLIRWRSGEGGGLESPAFPGPGWPDIHRIADQANAEAKQ